MEISINPQISLLMETADLVFVYANQMDPAVLTSDKLYCIPVPEIKRIMDEVCVGLNPQDRRLRFFFQSFTIENFKNIQAFETCAGSMLIHTCLHSGDCDLQASRKSMHGHFIGSGGYIEINSFNPCGIGTNSCSEYRSIAEELSAFDMPEGLRLRLLEVLSSFHHSVDELCDLLEPLAQRLLPLLEPWWAKMAPRLEQWREVLNTEKGLRDFVKMDTSKLESLQFSLHIFRPAVNRGLFVESAGVLHKDVGLDTQPVKEERDGFTPEELSALRLLSGADRIKMLRAMSDRVMTPKELTERLNLNSGSVFRDLNNLLQVCLVEMVETDGIHRSYKTNVAYLEDLVDQLVRYIKKQSL